MSHPKEFGERHMKKLLFVMIALASMAQTGVARADDCSGWDFLTCAAVSSMVISLSNLGAFGGGDSKAAYIAGLNDDAADFVADDQAMAGSVLQNAIREIRAQNADAQSLTDRQIAEIILKAN